MAIVQNVAMLALRPLVSGAAKVAGIAVGEEAVDGVVGFLNDRFSDHSKTLTNALQHASDRAWRALEIALAGESFLSRLDKSEDKAFRDQVRQFLDALPPDGQPVLDAEARALALKELRAARKAGLFGGALDTGELTKKAGPLARHRDPVAVVRAEWEILDEVASAVRAASYPALAQFLALRPANDASLLVVSVRYFFRREVEKDHALFQGLAFAQIDALGSNLEAGFDAVERAIGAISERLEAMLADLHVVASGTHAHVLDIHAELGRQGQQLRELGSAIFQMLQTHQLDRRALRPSDSFAVRGEAEAGELRALVRRFRALPEEQRREVPAMLNAVGKLQVVAGDFDAARRDFAQVAELVSDRAAQAEAHYNRYRAAVEHRRWDDALDALRSAARLDGERFAPFPLHKFEPERVLGAGGFGVAVLCRNRHSGGRVVVKSLRTDSLDRSVADVFREAQVLEDLDHAAIIRVRDCDFADAGQTRPFLVMDYFDGETLAEHVQKHGPLSPDDLTAVARPVADGLHAAHARNILHRDVKPANLLLRRDADSGSWKVKLIDFGLALRQTVVQATVASLRGASGNALQASVAGTIDYAAPEQMGRLPGAAVGPGADVYGFAKTCCFAMFQTPQPLRKHWKSVPDALADLLEQCLAENPKERPAGFADVLDRLGQPVMSQSTPAKPWRSTLFPDYSPPAAAQSTFWKTPPAPSNFLDEIHLEVAGAEERRFTGHTGGVTVVAFSPDGNRILSGGEDHTLRLWDVANCREIRCMPGHKNTVCCVAFTPEGDRALSSGTDQTVRMWDLNIGRAVGCFDRSTNRSAAFSTDGKLAVTGSLYDGMIRVWEVATGKELRRLKGHTDWVLTVAFSPDGRRILSGEMDRTIRLWEAETGKQLRCFTITSDLVAHVAFSPDGTQAASCGADRLVRLWDLRSGRETARLTGHTDIVLSVATSPDGTHVLSGGHDQTVRLWSLWTGAEESVFAGHAGPVASVAFSPDGRYAISGGGDGTVRLRRL